jgi:hypothetical protein
MSEYIVDADLLVATSSVSIPKYFLSLPTNEKVENATFVYNYYTRNEGVSEVVTLDSVDADSDEYRFLSENWENGAVPRQVEISFTSAGAYDSEILDPNTIRNAYDQNLIIFEEAPFDDSAISIIVHDTSIDEKIYRTTSALSEETDSIASDFLNSAKLQSSGYRFSKAQAREQIVASYENDIKSVNLGISINSLISYDLVKTVERWQASAFVDEFASTFDSLQSIQDQQRAIFSVNTFSVTEGEIDVTAPVISSRYVRTVGTIYTSPDVDPTLSFPTTKVGYIVEKYGEQLDGTTLRYPDYIIEDPGETSYVDTAVRYGGVYKYKIRTIYKITAITASEGFFTNGYFISEILVASQGVNTTVQCVESIPPDPPVNISFQQTLSGLYIRWNFPLNKQRDIKRFQVYRRTSIEQPFQIIREINFDKTILPYTSGETIPASLIDYESGPVKNYYDTEFNSLDSDYIYALCSVDAHGLSSGYSEQFRVRFDRITGKILITRISPEGAPKPYPNVRLTGDFFSDIIKDSGHSRVRVYFDPEYLDVTRFGESLSLISTTTTGAATYKICLTELNLGKNQTVDVVIGDNRIGADGIPVSIASLYTAS